MIRDAARAAGAVYSADGKTHGQSVDGCGDALQDQGLPGKLLSVGGFPDLFRIPFFFFCHPGLSVLFDAFPQHASAYIGKKKEGDPGDEPLHKGKAWS